MNARPTADVHDHAQRDVALGVVVAVAEFISADGDPAIAREILRLAEIWHRELGPRPPGTARRRHPALVSKT